MVRTKRYPGSNYRSVFFQGKTLRSKIDEEMPFLATPYPEIEDVAINNKCLANCSYCYTSATSKGTNFDNICEKALQVWGSLSLENRPYQIAIGGAGESTMHPDWVDFVETVRSLDIVPNYTTNGMHLTDSILRATEEYCGGVAVSFHPHIEKVFRNAVSELSKIKTKLNAHFIVGDADSLKNLVEYYNQYYDKIDYFVILPYQAVGRGEAIQCEETWRKLFFWMSNLSENERNKFALGALFYEYLNKTKLYESIELSMYEPELFSGYRLMDDTFKTLRKSSYDTEEKIIRFSI